MADEIGGIHATVGLDTTQVEAGVDRIKGSLNSVVTATRQFDTGMNGIGNSSGNAAMKLMLLAQTADDLQYGFRSIVNNIPQLAMAFGAGAGLAGAISIVAVGVNQLTQNWGALQDALGLGIPVPALEGLEKMTARLKEVDKRIEELKAKGRLSLPESGELARLVEEDKTLRRETADTRTLDTLKASRPREERERAAAFREAVAETGGTAAMDDLVHALRAMANERGEVALPGADAGTPQRVAESLMLEAAQGDRTAVDSILDALTAGKFGTSRFAENIIEASPEDRSARAGAPAAQAQQERESAARQRQYEDDLQAEQDRNVAKYDRARAIKAQMGRQEIDPADENIDRIARLTRRYGERMDALMAPEVRNSMVFDAASLNARVQSSVTNGPSEEARRIEAMHRELAGFREDLKRLTQPVQRGGR